jgi:hypothetical protein
LILALHDRLLLLSVSRPSDLQRVPLPGDGKASGLGFAKGADETTAGSGCLYVRNVLDVKPGVRVKYSVAIGAETVRVWRGTTTSLFFSRHSYPLVSYSFSPNLSSSFSLFLLAKYDNILLII